MEQGRYIAPNNAFSIALPGEYFGPNQESDFGDAFYVDLLWQRDVAAFPAFGLYAVDWFVLPRALSAEDFRPAGSKVLNEVIENRFGPQGQFKLTDSTFVADADRPTLQFIAVGQLRGKSAHWFGSVMLFGDRIGIASYVAYTDSKVRTLGLKAPSSAVQLPSHFVAWTKSLKIER